MPISSTAASVSLAVAVTGPEAGANAGAHHFVSGIGRQHEFARDDIDEPVLADMPAPLGPAARAGMLRAVCASLARSASAAVFSTGPGRDQAEPPLQGISMPDAMTPPRVVLNLASARVIEPFAGPVGRRGDRALTGAAADVPTRIHTELRPQRRTELPNRRVAN